MIAITASTPALLGQDKVFDRHLSFSWDINSPLSNTNFIKNTSVKGVMVSYRQRINNHLFLGIDLNNVTYHDYSPRQTYFLDGGAVTTSFYKYVVAYDVTLGGDYYFSPEKRLSPFAGLGVGANYNSYKLYYNIYSSEASGWGVLVRPQAGAILKIGEEMSWGVLAAIHYDYSTAASKDFAYTNFTNIGFRVGIVIGVGSGSPF